MSKYLYCCFTFEDESKARVGPVSIMRKKGDKSKYEPVAADDLPSEGVEVQWTDETSGSFSQDGFYSAKVHFNAGELLKFMFAQRVRRPNLQQLVVCSC